MRRRNHAFRGLLYHTFKALLPIRIGNEADTVPHELVLIVRQHDRALRTALEHRLQEENVRPAGSGSETEARIEFADLVSNLCRDGRFQLRRKSWRPAI